LNKKKTLLDTPSTAPAGLQNPPLACASGLERSRAPQGTSAISGSWSGRSTLLIVLNVGYVEELAARDQRPAMEIQAVNGCETVEALSHSRTRRAWGVLQISGAGRHIPDCSHACISLVIALTSGLRSGIAPKDRCIAGCFKAIPTTIRPMSRPVLESLPQRSNSHSTLPEWSRIVAATGKLW